MTNLDNIDVSAIVPVGYRFDPTGDIAEEYLDALKASGGSFELIFVLDGEHEGVARKLLQLAETEESVRIIQLAKAFGESTALTVGFEHSNGATLLTLPAYHQVDSACLPKVLAGLDDADMVVAARWPRAVASKFEEVRRTVFHWMIKIVGSTGFKDLGCGVRAMKRVVVEEIPVYGDQHHFLPLLAERRGFRVREIDVTQANKDHFEDTYGSRVYLRRLMDILTVFFLVRFTKKPLRLFGMIGSVMTILGGIVLLYVVIERLFFGAAMADRPVMFLSSLLVVLGIQLLALGLLGELIIFTHAKDIKEYTIEKIVN